ncbi:MAG: DUF4974 domain-containing protein [Muribaculaceae bacterium]|nr:DUF4974 domain-containing protein [Muribaculaceae bacterium]
MDKIDRLLDVMEHPERYSLTDIESMLQDPDVKEAFDLIDKTKSSLRTITTPDIEEEWKRFNKKHSRELTSKHRWHPIFFRNTAASIALYVASFTAVAAFVAVGIRHIYVDRTETSGEIPIVSEPDTVASQTATVKMIDVKEDMAPETEIFDNDTLETIIMRIGEYHGCNVIFNNEASKSLRLYFRWNQALSIEETVERLNNFEQIHITFKDKTIKVD